MPLPHDSLRHWQVIIIGGGPAGLSLGYELKRRSIPFLILEQGSGPGESWRRMPSNLKLVSPWKTNFLPGTEPSRWPRHFQLSRAEFFDYLRQYAQEHQLPLLAERKVLRVTHPGPQQFVVETAEESFTCQVLVNATGYFSRPRVPEYPGAKESSIPQIHVAAYEDPASLQRRFALDARPILIVGHRLSAGQTMVELVEAGQEVVLSHRSPLRFGSGPVGWWLVYRIFAWWEWLRLACGRGGGLSGPVPMAGGPARRLIRSGRVPTRPGIARFEKQSVVFDDGRTLQPSMVIYATGFELALDHLTSLLPTEQGGRPALREMESVVRPGLFFIGLDGGRNFQSRFLRGLRKDASYLAGLLAARLTV